MLSHLPQSLDPQLLKQTREGPAHETSHECQGSTPQFQSSIFSFLQKKGQALVVVVVPSDSPGPCCMTCTQGFWLQVPQYFRCGNARPVGWLATEMPQHCRRQADGVLTVSLIPCHYSSVTWVGSVPGGTKMNETQPLPLRNIQRHKQLYFKGCNTSIIHACIAVVSLI